MKLWELLTRQKLKIDMNCIICMSCLKYEPAELNLDGSYKYPDKLIRCNGYYETPCHHVYHAECLTKWLSVKLVCPQCRSDLP